jgi:hypothetical protein
MNVLVPTREWSGEVDKSKWDRGPWDDECDRKQWTDQDTGLPCLIVRNDRWGMWCGYVGVRPGHPYFEQKYTKPAVEVHGGLTYSDFCNEGRICHETTAEDRVWWLGFDCHHGYDYAPGFDVSLPPDLRQRSADVRYRNQAYVEFQCKWLAAQLAAITK